MNFMLAIGIQLALYVVGIIAAIVCIVRAVKLQRLASERQSQGGSWWESEEARQRMSYALKPLWITVIALLLGAFAPRLLGVMSGG